ncbi:hypothetical protein F4553_007796 [Allocatelliglobosispora scoriae]|uniref:Uncharacterized protein n=1 Tax=Allocatelliglobosispora scoriae TaxID=643052 RepID=A0A841C5L3_9ACTN|nr:hypothetical protein [Allocatelliglobosispora scoriae]MBB5874362.1 hypothetical protein [Allocatelliglobosispora scoriae]
MALLADRWRIVAAALMLFGVVALGFGAYNLRTWTWDTATGLVESCATRSVPTANGKYRTEHWCAVTWTADGATHRADVNFSESNAGTEQKLAVNGDTAVSYTTRYMSLVFTGIGAAMLVGGVILWRRRSRA